MSVECLFAAMALRAPGGGGGGGGSAPSSLAGEPLKLFLVLLAPSFLLSAFLSPTASPAACRKYGHGRNVLDNWQCRWERQGEENWFKNIY